DCIFLLVVAMGRHCGRAPGLRQRFEKIGHGLSRVAVKHVADDQRENHAVVVTSAERLVEKEMSGLLETCNGAKLVQTTLDGGMAGFPIVRLDAICLQHWIGKK